MGFMKIAAGIALSVSLLAGQTADANAAVSLTNGANVSTAIYCSQSLGWVRTTVSFAPRYGLSSQYVALRQHVRTPDGSGAWTDWRVLVAPLTTTFVAEITNATFQVYMEYAWYENGQWLVAGEWISTYGQVLGYGVTAENFCIV